MAPIVRNGADGERELVMARWGMPGPPQFGGAPITNIRNVGSPHWRGWLAEVAAPVLPQHDCFAIDERAVASEAANRLPAALYEARLRGYDQAQAAKDSAPRQRRRTKAKRREKGMADEARYRHVDPVAFDSPEEWC
jgi:hypothetical protein